MNSGILIGFVLSVVAVTILCISAWKLGTSTPFNFILIVFGGTAGWVAGILLTPSSQGEQETFTQVGTALVALITGFIGAMVHQAFQRHLAAAPLGPHFVAQVALTGAAFLLGGLATFMWRQYVSGGV